MYLCRFNLCGKIKIAKILWTSCRGKMGIETWHVLTFDHTRRFKGFLNKMQLMQKLQVHSDSLFRCLLCFSFLWSFVRVYLPVFYEILIFEVKVGIYHYYICVSFFTIVLYLIHSYTWVCKTPKPNWAQACKTQSLTAKISSFEFLELRRIWFW